MAKTYRYDPDENGGGRDYQAKKQAKKQVKFEKRRADRREFDDQADNNE